MREADRSSIGACGLRCAECDVYLAFRDGDERLKDEIAQAHGLDPSCVHCDGCWGDFSRMWGIEWQEGGKRCRIRPCAERHEVRICFECPDFPCQMLDEFHKQGYQKARENLLRMKEIGVREWLAERQK
jgi:hypothetical protein